MFLVPLKAFVVSRALVFAVLLVVSNLTSYSDGNYRHIKVQRRSFTETISVADFGHYQNIAQHGYNAVNAAFFPLWPLMLRAVGGNVIAGMLLSNVLFYLALVVFYRWRRDEQALWYLCLFPTSYFFSLPYSESLFLLLSLLAFAHSPLWGIPAAFTRFVGIALLPSLLPRKSALLIPLGLLSAMSVFYFVLGDPLAFLRAQRHFGRELFSYGLTVFPGWTFAPLSLAFIGLWLWAGLRLWSSEKQLAIYTLVSLVLPLLSGLASVPRYAAVVFPIALAMSRQKCDLRILFAAALVILTALCAMRVVFAVA